MRIAIRSALVAVFLASVSMTAALACNKDFYVYNETDKTITQFYVSPNQSDNWEDSVLQSPIEPDTKKHVDMTSDTRELSIYDVKAVYEDGTKTVGTKINLCRATGVYIYADHVEFSDAQ
jgi:hypothetical protein